MTKTINYSISELAKESKIPASTVRYYRDAYSEYFSSTRLPGSRYPVYDKECINVLKAIQKALKEGKKKHEVIAEIGKKFTPIYNGESDESAKPQANNEQTNNKQLATNEAQGLNVMQTMQQMAKFNENQLQLTEHYKTQADKQKDVIEELTSANEAQTEHIKELESKISRLQRPSFLDVFKKA